MMARATVRAIISKWKKKTWQSSEPSKKWPTFQNVSQSTAITYPRSHKRPKENIEGTAELCKRHWTKIASMELWQGENYY